jgi:RNA ligase
MNKTLLREMVNEKLVSVQKHPDAELFIYNYSPRVQYEKLWNEVTTKTRGLILDSDMNIVARPFGKFFNIEEHSQDEIPNLPFEVYEKMDGSLGILYWLNGKPFIATRGSFTSDQAIHATEVLHKKYSHLFNLLDKQSTYLFEIIYPENRIVVDYGDLDDLVLLTVIENNTGVERIEHIGFPVVKSYDGINDINTLKQLEESNREGFVIKFSSGFRVKVKFDEYVRLHRIITGISNITIWEHLSNNKPLNEVLDRVPDEFYDWVKETESDLKRMFDSILSEAKSLYREFDNRKDAAMYFKTQKHQSILFSLLDKRSPDATIWKMIKPKYSKPFSLKND